MQNNTAVNKKLITLSINGAFFMIGITFTVFGPTMSFLMDGYGISLAQAGLFMTFMALGRTLSVIFSGMLSDFFGSKWVVTLGTAFLTIGLIGIGSLSVFSIAIIFAFIAGIGHGAVDTSGSSIMIDLYPDKTSSALNKTNMFFAIGCLVGPLIYGGILSFTTQWRIVYFIGAGVGFIITSLLIAQKFPDRSLAVEKNVQYPYKMLLGSGNLWLLALIMFLYSGSGHSINAWINKYMGDVVKLSIFLSSGSLAIYNLGLATGRFVCSMIAEKLGYHRIILLGAVGGLLSMVLSLFSSGTVLMITGLGLTGFFFGGLFPTTVAMGGQLYFEQKGFVTGILVMLAALGSMTIPAITGVVSYAIGLERGMKSLAIWGVLLVAVAGSTYRLGNKREQNIIK